MAKRQHHLLKEAKAKEYGEKPVTSSKGNALKTYLVKS